MDEDNQNPMPQDPAAPQDAPATPPADDPMPAEDGDGSDTPAQQ